MRVEHKIVAAFLIAFGAVCLVGAITYLDARSLLTRNHWVVHTYQVLQKIDQSFQSLQDMESGGRGFLFTGRDAYLETFQKGVAALEGELDELQQVTIDNPIQQSNVTQYRALAERNVAAMKQRIDARKSGIVAALQPFLGTDAKSQMDEVRALTNRMIAEENFLLDQRTRDYARSAQRTLTTFTVLLGLAAFLLLGFYLFIRHDLADRRLAAAALEDSDRRFRSVLESAPDAMLISNAEGIITISNTEASRLFGYSREELVGRPLSSLLLDRAGLPAEELELQGEPDSERIIHAPALADMREHGAHFDGVRRNGERFPVDFSQSPLESAQEHLMITAVRDRTEQQRAEDALRKFSLDLARSNAELERFAYVASHDLQEPLRMVSSYTQLLSRRYKGKLDENADEFISYAVDGANRMQKLIGDLLMLSRVGTQAKPSEPVDTGAVLKRVLGDLQQAIETTGAEIHQPETMPVVCADGTQIGQLFQNILGNGLKFHGDAPPRIEITVETQGDGWWRFAFKDNGIGIEPQYFERIFVIFQRLHGKDRYGGTGIGLAICKKIVERHGGKLWVESKPGEGTTFLFTLPAVSVQL
jgi:PAS domain S-box-containing protein